MWEMKAIFRMGLVTELSLLVIFRKRLENDFFCENKTLSAQRPIVPLKIYRYLRENRCRFGCWSYHVGRMKV